MKKLFIMMTLMTSISSFNAGAGEVVGMVLGGGTVLVSAVASTSGVLTSLGLECNFMVCKEANQVIEDTQIYSQTGELSVFLNQKIKDVQTLNNEFSEEEALDLLVSNSLAILK